MIGVGIDSDKAGDLAVYSSLFSNLAAGRLLDSLSWLDAAAGDGPVVVVGAQDQQDALLLVCDYRADGRDDAVRGRRAGVVQVIRSWHVTGRRSGQGCGYWPKSARSIRRRFQTAGHHESAAGELLVPGRPAC